MRKPTLFCHQVKEGKVDAVKQFISDCADEKHDQYIDLLRRYDLNDTRWWFHNLNGVDYLMFTHDMGSEGFDRLAKWPNSDNPFDHWFEERLLELFVADPDNHQPAFFNEIKV